MTRYIPTFLTGLLIIWMTLVPQPLGDTDDLALWLDFDKTVHMLLFGLLTAVWLFDRWRGRKGKPSAVVKVSLAITLGVVAIGGAVELLQEVMGIGRSGDTADFIADSIGAVGAATGWMLGRLSR